MDYTKIRILINNLIDNKKYNILFNTDPILSSLEQFNRCSILKKFSYNPSLDPILYMTDIYNIKYFIIKEFHGHRYFSFSIDNNGLINHVTLVPQIFYNIELKYNMPYENY